MANIVNMEPTALLAGLAFTLRRQEENERHRLERQQLRLQEKELRMRQNAVAQQAQAEANRAVQASIGSLSDTLGNISQMYARRKEANALAAYRGEQLGLQRQQMEQRADLATMREANDLMQAQAQRRQSERNALIAKGWQPVVRPEDQAALQAIEQKQAALDKDYQAGNISPQDYTPIAQQLRAQRDEIDQRTELKPPMIDDAVKQAMKFFPKNDKMGIPGFWTFMGANGALHVLQQRNETGGGAGDATTQRQQTTARRKLYLDAYEDAQNQNFLRNEPYPESEVAAEATRNAIRKERFLQTLGLETGGPSYEGYEARPQEEETTTDEEDWAQYED